MAGYESLGKLSREHSKLSLVERGLLSSRYLRVTFTLIALNRGRDESGGDDLTALHLDAFAIERLFPS